jgi:hypothetical protein
MNRRWFSNRLCRGHLRHLALIAGLSLFLGGFEARQDLEVTHSRNARDKAIPAQEFARLIADFSEQGGYFRSDNFVSNETSYLLIVDRLKELAASGGAYIGVGPEQNFTYIAKIRPRIAFIVDIRRQAVIQHLMFKAIFHYADSPARFLSLLFSKPLTGGAQPGANASVEDLVAYFSKAPVSNTAYTRNLSLITNAIVRDFHFPLDLRDRSTLEYVYSTFRDENLDLRYQSGGFRYGPGAYGYRNWGGWGYFPTLRDLLLETDLHGRTGNFLASRSDYDFVRGLEEANRVIPVVGDFVGSKALPAVAEYLKRQGYTVTAFYTSNVEQYLFSGGGFDDFARNVARLPISDKSLFIRAYPNQRGGREPHPAQIGNHRLVTLMEKIGVFLDDYRHGLYPDYWTLVRTHYIAAQEP